MAWAAMLLTPFRFCLVEGLVHARLRYGNTFGFLQSNGAPVSAVREVEDKAGYEPHEKREPHEREEAPQDRIAYLQEVNHEHRGDHCQNRNQVWTAGYREFSGQFRMSIAQPGDCARHEDEGDERPHIRQRSENADWEERAGCGDDDSEQNLRYPR